MAFKIITIPLFLGEVIGAQGTAGTALSDIIDMRDICEHGECSLTMDKRSTAGASGTCGSSVLSYQACGTRDGTFAAAGTFATFGANIGSRIKAFTPIVAPFIKIKVVTGTSAALAFTGELNVR